VKLQDVISVPFVGNHGTHLLMSSFNHSQLNTSYYSLGTTLNDQVSNPFYGEITSSGYGLDQLPISIHIRISRKAESKTRINLTDTSPVNPYSVGGPGINRQPVPQSFLL
jgi:hypothetical protein